MIDPNSGFWDALHNLVEEIFKNHPEVSDFRDRWAYITDVDTNDIRDEGKKEAMRLAIELLAMKEYDLFGAYSDVSLGKE